MSDRRTTDAAIGATVVPGKATPRGKYPHVKQAGDFPGRDHQAWHQALASNSRSG